MKEFSRNHSLEYAKPGPEAATFDEISQLRQAVHKRKPAGRASQESVMKEKPESNRRTLIPQTSNQYYSNFLKRAG